MVNTATLEVTKENRNRQTLAFANKYLPRKPIDNYEPCTTLGWTTFNAECALETYGPKLTEVSGSRSSTISWDDTCLAYEFCRAAVLHELWQLPDLLGEVNQFIGASSGERIRLCHANPQLSYKMNNIIILMNCAHYIKLRLLTTRVETAAMIIERSEFEDILELTQHLVEHLNLRHG